MTQQDWNKIMAELKLLKDELREEFNANSNIHSGVEEATNQSVSDNTDAILELAEIIGG